MNGSTRPSITVDATTPGVTHGTSKLSRAQGLAAGHGSRRRMLSARRPAAGYRTVRSCSANPEVCSFDSKQHRRGLRARTRRRLRAVSLNRQRLAQRTGDADAHRQSIDVYCHGALRSGLATSSRAWSNAYRPAEKTAPTPIKLTLHPTPYTLHPILPSTKDSDQPYSPAAPARATLQPIPPTTPLHRTRRRKNRAR